MSLRRRLALLSGVAAAALGLAVAFEPRLDAPAVNLWLFALLGILALGAGLTLLATRALRRDPRPPSLLPPAEPPFVAPGSTDDDRLVADPAALLADLRSRTVSVLVRVANAPEAEVRDRLTRGTWADDEVAASAFAREANDSSGRRFAPRDRRTVQRVTAALARAADADPSEPAALPPLPSLEARAVALLERYLPRRFDSADRPAERRVESARRSHAADAADERRTGRWRGASAVALLALGVGVLARHPGPLLVGVVAVGATAYARLSAPPTVELAVARTVSESNPEPGDEVEVTVSVRNAGDDFLADLRLVDGAPDGLVVADGSPRHATALGPGAATEFSYAVRVGRGVHAFGDVYAAARAASGAAARAGRVSPVEPTTVTCRPPFEPAADVPLRERTTPYVGHLATDSGGSGIEFHTVREYQSGDPLSRVDWNRLAGGGDLSTLQFREERAARVFLVVDAREEAYRSVEPPTAVERSVEAAGRLALSLLADGHRVGLGALSPADCWLHSGSGNDHRTRIEVALATHPALSPAPPDDPFLPTVQRYRLRQRLPGDSQLVLCSPLTDEYPISLARHFEALGTPVTVVSPDPAGSETVGRQLARVERAGRTAALRRVGVPVLDWGRGESLDLALARMERWSR